MNRLAKTCVVVAFGLLFLPIQTLSATETGSTVATELSALVRKVQTRINVGKRTEQDLAAELEEFDALFAKHAGEKTEATADILVLKARLYVEVLDNPAKAIELIRQIKRDFPETRQGQNANRMLAQIEQQEVKRTIQRTLAVGAPFPDFTEKDLQGKPLSVAALKGKVVLIDFWATWCGPCLVELPALLQTYTKYHDKGLEIIGISLDNDEGRLTTFLKQRGVSWPQFFDGKGWQNKLAVKYGVDSIPATYLLDREGKIIAAGLQGAELEKAVAKAVGER
jgi:thiol-disulfide isomerase/thioredoxin/Skp family chaperone for outer membrane proteins